MCKKHPTTKHRKTRASSKLVRCWWIHENKFCVAMEQQEDVKHYFEKLPQWLTAITLAACLLTSSRCGNSISVERIFCVHRMHLPHTMPILFSLTFHHSTIFCCCLFLMRDFDWVCWTIWDFWVFNFFKEFLAKYQDFWKFSRFSGEFYSF